MSVSRRAFLIGAAALSVTPTAARPTSSDSVTVVCKLQPEYGYSLDGEFWNMGFGSHAEALLEAAGYAMPGDRVETGITSLRRISIPDDLGTEIVNGLLNGNRNIQDILVCALQGRNEENDFEGDFDIACSNAPLDGLEGATAVVHDALCRHGLQAWSAAILAGEPIPFDSFETDDRRLDAFTEDLDLNADLRRILSDWAEDQDLERELRSIYLQDVKITTLPELPVMSGSS